MPALDLPYKNEWIIDSAPADGYLYQILTSMEEARFPAVIQALTRSEGNVRRDADGLQGECT
jgi:hypothetical protein